MQNFTIMHTQKQLKDAKTVHEKALTYWIQVKEEYDDSIPPEYSQSMEDILETIEIIEQRICFIEELMD